jgi:hypothetical protein
MAETPFSSSNLILTTHIIPIRQIPVAERFKAWVCGRTFAGIAGSVPAWTWMSVSCVLYVVRYESLRRADPSSRGVLPTVVRNKRGFLSY